MIKEFDIIKVDNYNRAWIVINVTQEDLDLGYNTDHTGLHLFGGFWYGEDPSLNSSFGKMIDLPETGYNVIGTIHDFDLIELKKLLD